MKMKADHNKRRRRVLTIDGGGNGCCASASSSNSTYASTTLVNPHLQLKRPQVTICKNINQQQHFNQIQRRRRSRASSCADLHTDVHDCRFIIRRLKQYLLYSNLRSLIPPAPPHHQLVESSSLLHEGDHQVDVGDEMTKRTNGSNTNISSDDDDHDEDKTICTTTIEFESDEDEATGGSNVTNSKKCRPFVPSIKIEKLGEDSVVITTTVLKQTGLSSSLFQLLEEDENVDIVFENQFRTETKVSHTIHLKLIPNSKTCCYNLQLLERKLHTWATGRVQPAVAMP